MMRHCLLVVFLAGAALESVPAEHPRKDHQLVTPDGLKWADGPPSLPPGCKGAVLEGDPSKKGPFVIRVKMPAGYRVRPHTHPQDERVTVLAGTVYFGTGEKFDETVAKARPAGSYARMPAGVAHFGFTKEEAVIQVQGVVPWAINYVNPDDDPRNKK